VINVWVKGKTVLTRANPSTLEISKLIAHIINRHTNVLFTYCLLTNCMCQTMCHGGLIKRLGLILGRRLNN